MPLRHLDLFSGIGGFALAARMVGGYETVAFCEIEPYCQAVLRKHWPTVPVYDDVRALTGRDVGAVDVITGGFPCQDVSVAGRQAGIDGTRSGLWTELARLVGDIRPRFALVENVPMLLAGGRGEWFGRVLGDLAEIGYDAQWHSVPASHVGAYHRRDRVWVMAYPDDDRRDVTGDLEKWAKGQAFDTARALGEQRANQPRAEAVAYPDDAGRREQWRSLAIQTQLAATERCCRWEPEPGVGRVAHGIPARVDRLEGLGNSIVPQVAAIFLKAIKECEGINA